MYLLFKVQALYLMFMDRHASGKNNTLSTFINATWSRKVILRCILVVCCCVSCVCCLKCRSKDTFQWYANLVDNKVIWNQIKQPYRRNLCPLKVLAAIAPGKKHISSKQENKAKAFKHYIREILLAPALQIQTKHIFPQISPNVFFRFFSVALKNAL